MSNYIDQNFTEISLIFEQGTHQNYHFKNVAPMLRLLDKNCYKLNKRFKVKSKTFITPPIEGPGKRRNTLKSIKNRNMQQQTFNQKIKTLTENLNWKFLDIQNLTENVFSIDGLHHGYGVYATMWSYYFKYF